MKKHLPVFSVYLASFALIMILRDDFAMSWHAPWMMGFGMFIGVITAEFTHANHD